MLVLLAIGLVAGAITAISPCVLPVLPILLAGGATGGRRRPYAIVAGLVASFTVFTLFAAWLLGKLGLPQDLAAQRRDRAALPASPPRCSSRRSATLLERPFARLTRRRGGELGGGFLLGVSLGLVFVPCAGPVLAAVTVVAASSASARAPVALTVAYAVGAAIPMLAIALGGRAAAGRLRAAARALRDRVRRA